MVLASFLRSEFTPATRAAWRARLTLSFLALLLGAWLLTWLLTATANAQPDQRRMALIVGNSDYREAEVLPNAARDARALASSVENLGFEVTLLLDTEFDQFERTVTRFAQRAEDADVVLFYFSGHGFQLEGANFLAPVSASLRSVEEIEAQTLRLDRIIADISGPGRQTVVLLDACRNNPLPPSLRGTSRDGLAQTETGTDTFVAFATQPNNITFDGRDGNSPFTTALLTHLDTPGVSISEMMIRVRSDVSRQTLGRQIPWDQSSLTKPFYFNAVQSSADDMAEIDLDMFVGQDRERREWAVQFLVSTGMQITIEEIDAELRARGLLPEEEAIEVAAAPPEPEPEPEQRPQFLTVPVPTGAPEREEPAAESVAEPAPEPELAEAPEPVARDPEPEPESAAADVAEADASEPAVEEEALDLAALPSPPEPELSEAPEPAARDPEPEVESPAADVAEADASEPAVEEEALDLAALPSPPEPEPQPEPDLAARPDPLPEPEADPVPELAEDPAPDLEFPDISSMVATRVAAESPSDMLVLAALEPGQALTPHVGAQRRIIGVEIEPEVLPDNIVFALQEELARVGCYRMRVDGMWGRGSAQALVNFYMRTGLNPPSDTQPSAAIWRTVRDTEGEVCPPPAPRAAAPTPTTGTGTRTGGQAQAPAPAPAPQPTQPSGGRGLDSGRGVGGLR